MLEAVWGFSQLSRSELARSGLQGQEVLAGFGAEGLGS